MAAAAAELVVVMGEAMEVEALAFPTRNSVCYTILISSNGWWADALMAAE